MTYVTMKAAVVAIWLWAWSLVMPVQHFLVFTIILVLCDFITGVTAARHRKEQLRSRGFMRSVVKIMMYCMTILLCHGMDLVFFAPNNLSFGLVKIAAGLIALTEFKSNLENVWVVTGVDFWARIAEVIPAFFKLPKSKDP